MLRRRRKSDEDDENYSYPIDPGDIGIMLIAAACTLGFILLMVMPSPVAKVQAKLKAAVQARQEKQIDRAAASAGVVMVTVPRAGRH